MTRPSFLNLTAFAEDRVRADHDVDLTGLQVFPGLLRLGRGHQPRQPADADREAVQPLDEIPIVLAGEQRGRSDYRDLHARHCGDEGGPQRDLGLAEADVAANQAVHRLARLEVGEHFLDRAVLVVRFLIGEAIDELRIGAVRLDDGAGPRGPHRGRLDELARNLADPLLHPRLAPLPCFAAETVERHAFALAAVAGQQVDILDRNVELVAAGIFERDAVVRRLADHDRCQPFVAADAMIVVDDEVARRERRKLRKERRRALALLAPADEPVAEHVLLGEDGDVRRGEAMVERQDHQCRLRLAAERFLPVVDQLLRLETVVVEQA